MKRAARLSCSALIAACVLANGAAADSTLPPGGPIDADVLGRELSQVEKQERALAKRYEDAAREARDARTRLVARGRAYVRISRVGLLPIGAGFEALVDHAARVERLRRAIARDLELEQRLAKERVALAKQMEEARTRRAGLELQERAATEARTALLAAQDRALAFARAFGGGGDHTAIYGAGAGLADPADARAGFAALRGRLPFPIEGRTEVRSARRASSDGPGLELRAPVGTPVRATFAGRVAFADEYADYGKTVILDHGDRHYTVSGNLGEVSVAVGDELRAGDRLGTVGRAENGSGLYFEIRVGNQNADPAEWFGL